jgi:dihydrofolate synthase/folylpolyglutamate synthase
LRGRHQADNAVVATRVLEVLAGLGLPVGKEAVRAAIVKVMWPGRLDARRDEQGREVLLDGAHNPAGARVLASYLQEVYPQGLPLVFGVMSDKDASGMLRPLLPSASPLVVTRPPTGRAMDPSTLEGVARQSGYTGTVVVTANAGEAIERAWSFAPRICACGSLYLAGEILGLLGLQAWQDSRL